MTEQAHPDAGLHRIVHLWLPLILTGAGLVVVATYPGTSAATYIWGYLWGTAATLWGTR